MTLIRTRIFKPAPDGGWYYNNTAFIRDTGNFASDLTAVPGVEDGDIVYVHDFFFLRQGEKWVDVQYDDPRVRNLYYQAVEAEREMEENHHHR